MGLDNIVKRRVAKGVCSKSISVLLSKALMVVNGQSIGFTANLPQPEEDKSNGFMPFFTPNRRVSQNILDLVEPGGEHHV